MRKNYKLLREKYYLCNMKDELDFLKESTPEQISQIFEQCKPNFNTTECYFTIDSKSTSLTICKNCGKDKSIHTIGEGIKANKLVIFGTTAGENNFHQDLVKYFKENPKEKILVDWNKSAELDKIGPTVEEFNINIAFIKLKEAIELLKQTTEYEVLESFREKVNKLEI